MIRPVGLNTGFFDFAALNTSQGFDITSLSLDALSDTLPFANDGQNVAILPAIDEQDNIYVLTGDCKNGAGASALWQFTPSMRSLNGNGTWQEMQITTKMDEDFDSIAGANYLAAAGLFSISTNSTPSMYTFGGMCPTSTLLTANDWTSSADYSNLMLSIEPSSSSTNLSIAFDLTLSSGRGGPIAEAGFTMTALSPTFSNSTDDSVVSQNQNFVLIGGHTQQAFINMSQIALFSLPEQTWSFIPVDQPADSPNTDLAIRDNLVDPRSGHTATMTSDGRRIIIVGGWVGEVSNPAVPQIAVLELGSGYGGSGDWQWTVPNLSGAGLLAGAGLYGHGATMLAGDILLVTGGYHIPPSGGSEHKRDTSSPNSQNYLFNTTSNTWISSYTRPKTTSQKAAEKGSESRQSKSERAGLGVGLTFGIVAIIVAVIVHFWYSRRLRRRREVREEELRRLAAGAHSFHLSPPSEGPRGPNEMAMVNPLEHDSSTHGSAYPWMAAHSSAQSRPQHGASEAERTGLLYEIPSPTRGLRRSLHSRATYQPALRFDDGRRAAGLGAIHPIDEQDEYDDPSTAEGAGDGDTLHRQEYHLLSNVPVLDPFRDPPDDSRTPSPQSPQEREAEIRGWVDDWTAAETLLHGGRLSPEKTDRTSSTLSDQSARSLMSHSSMQQSVGTVSRTVSQRSANVFTSASLRPTNDSPSQDIPNAAAAAVPIRHGHRRTRSLGLSPGPSHTVRSETVTTNAESLPHLQLESEALLGEYAGRGETSPTKLQQRARGWMGSVRRALTGNDRSTSTSPENNASTSSSPTKPIHDERDLPRRAASTGGMFWQKRQGAKDWETDAHADAHSRSNGPDDDDGEWDVESAVERRVVQVMFTVPKEKLRVVNQGPEEDGASTHSAHTENGGNAPEASEHPDKGKERE